MTIVELSDMAEALMWSEERDSDLENQRVAWQTAHLMNASGNFKKRIQPTDLYNPQDNEETEKREVVKRFDSAEQKQEYLQTLMQKFSKE